MIIPDAILRSVFFEVERVYPDEGCGVLLFSDQKDQWRHVPVRNAQDDYHRQDPSTFVRTAREAYAFDARELLKIHKGLRQTGEMLRVIYHSHPDQEACFSAEDRRLALDEDGEPVYANTAYLVISVRAGRAESWKLFTWNPFEKEFSV